MSGHHKRYFIELQPKGEDVPRNREAEQRRQQAAVFIDSLNEWLKTNDLNSKVSAMAITALGQVQITCEADVIGKIHTQEEDHIATIRHGAAYVEGISRWNRQGLA